jgi:hypothetical protein
MKLSLSPQKILTIVLSVMHLSENTSRTMLFRLGVEEAT